MLRSSDGPCQQVLFVLLLGAAIGGTLTMPRSARAQTAVIPSGSGTEADPYLIYELGHLVWMGYTVPFSTGKYYIMTADIDASETALWNDEGTDTDVLEGFDPINDFDGIFDGAGHTITDLVINRPNTDKVGLFSEVRGKVLNLGMVGGTVTGLSRVGGLIGFNTFSTVSNCYTTTTVTGSSKVGGLIGYHEWCLNFSNCYATGPVSGHEDVGGLVGDSHIGNLSNCYATGPVSGDEDVGGLVGNNYHGHMLTCYATGEVGGATNVGGLLGYNYWGLASNCYATGEITGEDAVGGLVGNHCHGHISNCYATGDVWGSTNVGGLFGYKNWGTAMNCYATGAVTGDTIVGGLVGSSVLGSVWRSYAVGAVTGNSIVGGLVGYEEKSSVWRSYWDIETSGQSTSAGGEGKTTAEMMQQATFVDWDFAEIWGIVNNKTYPYLLSLINDSDDDGIPDELDECAESDLSETIIINDYDTGVVNQAMGDGCTMADEIVGLAESSANHGDFVNQVSHLTNAWKRDGLISGAEKGKIQSAAAR